MRVMETVSERHAPSQSGPTECSIEDPKEHESHESRKTPGMSRPRAALFSVLHPDGGDFDVPLLVVRVVGWDGRDCNCFVEFWP